MKNTIWECMLGMRKSMMLQHTLSNALARSSKRSSQMVNSMRLQKPWVLPQWRTDITPLRDSSEDSLVLLIVRTVRRLFFNRKGIPHRQWSKLSHVLDLQFQFSLRAALSSTLVMMIPLITMAPLDRRGLELTLREYDMPCFSSVEV